MALACAAAATPLFAQVNTGVGADAVTHQDPNWFTAWNPIPDAGGTAAYGQGQAYVVQSPPSPPWANTAPNSFWISNNTTASLGGGVGDGQVRYNYAYQTIFTSSTAPIQMTVWTDNVFTWFTLDGHAFSAAQSGIEPFAPQVFTLNPTTSGEHTLLLQTTGDGVTDGINVQFSSVPEPSSMALLGTGLFGLIPMVRRRRKS